MKPPSLKVDSTLQAIRPFRLACRGSSQAIQSNQSINQSANTHRSWSGLVIRKLYENGIRARSPHARDVYAPCTFQHTCHHNNHSNFDQRNNPHLHFHNNIMQALAGTWRWCVGGPLRTGSTGLMTSVLSDETPALPFCVRSQQWIAVSVDRHYVLPHLL